MQITLAEAAKMAGITKQGVRRGIDAGKLTAAKDEHGRILVQPADVERVWPRRPELEPEAQPEAIAARVRAVAVAEAENRLLRERLAELADDRDNWRRQAERVAVLLTDQRPWWSRLIGGSRLSHG